MSRRSNFSWLSTEPRPAVLLLALSMFNQKCLFNGEHKNSVLNASQQFLWASCGPAPGRHNDSKWFFIHPFGVVRVLCDYNVLKGRNTWIVSTGGWSIFVPFAPESAKMVSFSLILLLLSTWPIIYIYRWSNRYFCCLQYLCFFRGSEEMAFSHSPGFGNFFYLFLLSRRQKKDREKNSFAIAKIEKKTGEA